VPLQEWTFKRTTATGLLNAHQQQAFKKFRPAPATTISNVWHLKVKASPQPVQL
jgi:hypothetical protein